jgi:asparaginyl-tRNA synthetase
MQTTSIRELYQGAETYAGKNITVAGWVRTVRDSKTFGFIELNDGTFFKGLQIVFADNLSNFKEIAKLGVGASIIVTGKLILTPNQKQPFELQALEITVEGACPPEYPLQKKRHSFEFLRQIAYLRPRTNTFSAVFRIRSLASYAIHKFFQERNFVYVHTPIITASDCEGAGEMFRVTTLDPKEPKCTPDGEVDFSEDFFGKMANLTAVSLHLILSLRILLFTIYSFRGLYILTFIIFIIILIT